MPAAVGDNVGKDAGRVQVRWSLNELASAATRVAAGVASPPMKRWFMEEGEFG